MTLNAKTLLMKAALFPKFDIVTDYSGIDPSIFRYPNTDNPWADRTDAEGPDMDEVAKANGVEFVTMRQFPEIMAQVDPIPGKYELDTDRLIGIDIDVDDFDDPSADIHVADPGIELTPEFWYKYGTECIAQFFPDDIDIYILESLTKYQHFDADDHRLENISGMQQEIANCIKNGNIPLFWLIHEGDPCSGHAVLYMAKDQEALKTIFGEEVEM